ncbi:MAG: translation elongation factor 4 [Candidatus Jorgensenbacteria bacterium]
METEHIRNFVIIAHVDHGKSTLADRFLELTGTVEARRMKAQYLDQLELERERGITIKMAPVRMSYTLHATHYTLNLIDTPGHSDFSYEVSRALEAVEGGILLVDATQGIQAQTLANFRAAKAAGLVLIGAVNKVDLFGKYNDNDDNDDKRDERIRKVVYELAELLEVPEGDILLVSGKTGKGVRELLETVIKKIPPPRHSHGNGNSRALIFDSFYDDHKGVVASVRVFDGTICATDEVQLLASGVHSKLKELGYFAPELKSLGGDGALRAGDIGYLATGIRDAVHITIGDTVTVWRGNRAAPVAPLTGYHKPQPVVFVSFYPEDSDDYEILTKGLEKLRLNDSALSIEPDQNEVLGRGYKVGFLGRLHFEIVSERLKREFGARTVNTFPSVAYRVKVKNEWRTIVKPDDMPPDALAVEEPLVTVSILASHAQLGNIMPLQARFRMRNVETETLGDHAVVRAVMPLMELVSDFDDQLKSATAGYASFSYELAGYAPADVVKVSILISGETVPGLSRFFSRETHEREARKMVERLKKLLPRRQFAQPVQAAAEGRIIAREDIQALRKDVTGYLYGGDRTRKMKLWKKQKRGKERLKERAEATIPPEVFKELLKK